MRNILAPRCICWSVLQVVVFVVCYRGKVSIAETAQGCIESRLSLECPEMKVINVTAVVLGDTDCVGTGCCIKDNDCTHRANDLHTTEVHSRCDGQRRCTVTVIKEQIPCWYLKSWSHNDFERITYNCTDDPRNGTTNSTDEQYDDDDDVTTPVPNADSSSIGKDVVRYAVMVTICVLVLVAIIVVVVMIRRKKRTQVKYGVEMADLVNSDQNEAIYANDNQNPSLNHGNGSMSPTYSQVAPSKAKKPNYGAKAFEAHEMPGNAVYSLAGDAGSTPTEDPIVYCNVDSKEPRYQAPVTRPDVYSVVRDFEDPGRAGSAANASGEDGNIYSDVETREPAGDVYEEACNVKGSEYKVVTKDKAKPDQKKASPSHTKAPDSYSKVNKPSKNAAATSLLKAAFPGKAEPNGEANTSDGFPSPTYETMSPGIIPEGIYANEPALSPTRSLVASITSSGGSQTETPYCDMQSPPIKFKEDGSQTLIENDLYSH